MKAMDRALEQGLWSSRLVVLVAVIASLVVAAGVTYIITVDVVIALGRMASYADPALSEAARAALRLNLIGEVVGIVDGYLLGAVLVVFALGLYELFISQIEALEKSPFAARLLHIRSIDDLKDRLGRVVLLIVIVKFSQLALQLKYQTPQDLLYLAVGVLLIGGALYLTSHKNTHA